MRHYLVSIDMSGDPCVVESVIDEIVAGVSFIDLEHVCVEISAVEE